MSNDPSKQAKTILGWLPQPGAAAQVPGAPPAAVPASIPHDPRLAAGQAATQVAMDPGPGGVQAYADARANPHGAAAGYGAMPNAAPHAPNSGWPPSAAPHNAYGAQHTPYGAPPNPYSAPPNPYGAPPNPYAAPPNPYGAPPSAAPQTPYSAPPSAAPQTPYSAPQNPYGAQHTPYGAPPSAAPHDPHGALATHAAHGGGAPVAARGLAEEPRPMPGASDLRERANATVGISDRLRFIRLTYLHLLGAILAFAGLEYLLMTNGMLVQKVSIPLVTFALGGRWNWGVVLAVFMAVSWIADFWASHTTARPLQYAGLAFYVIAEALIFVPLLAIVQWKTAEIIARGGGNPNILRDAALTTLGIFGALTASVFITKKDFSFLRTGLMMASAAAMMLIVLSLAFGFNLGIVFSIAMVLLAASYILFQTSQVLAHYDPRNHVAAALALFSSIALMFWYVIRIFMRMRE